MMDREEFEKMLNDKIELAECMFVSAHWKNPKLFEEIEFDRNKLSDDGNFYYSIARRLWLDGNTNLNQSTTEIFFDNHESLKVGWEDRGGYQTVKSMMSVTDINNIEAYQNNLVKYLYAKELMKKGFDLTVIPLPKFEAMSAEQLYGYFTHQLNNTDMQVCTDLDFESLDMSDAEFQALLNGENLGIQYWKGGSKLLNSMTMGLPRGNITSICGHINAGKSSFVFSNIIIGALESDKDVKCLVISNEMKSDVYKHLLIIYVLTKKLNYWKINRKKLKSGRLNDEEIEKVNEARKYIKEHYSHRLVFLKIFDYDISVVEKAIKKYSQLGFSLVVYDVLKTSDATDSIWQKLIEDSKSLFQCASKYDVAVCTTQQLAMSTKNKVSVLDLSCLSSSKQSAEVMSEVIMIRQLMQCEKDKEHKRYCKPFQLIFDEHGKCVGKKEIELEEDGCYYVFFLAKSRNDSTDKVLLYRFYGGTNSWEELGYAHIQEGNFY